jgi:hypothetical protein
VPVSSGVTDAEARQKFGINGHGDRAGLIFPYCDPLTDCRHTARLRRDRPDVEDGKPKAKYISAYGDQRHLYFVPGCRELVQDAAVPIILVEAEKSTLALSVWAARAGRKLLPVGLGGCWGWRGRIGRVENSNGDRVDEVGPLPELCICSNGRKTYILLDANASTNVKVQQARAALAQQLRKQRADICILELPAADGVNGPDDYIAACGDEAMANLFASVEAGAAVLSEVESFLRRYVAATDAEIILISAWVVHTHMMKAAKSTPYLAITSAEKQSGKSRLLEVLELVVHKPWMTGRVTAACSPGRLMPSAPPYFWMNQTPRSTAKKNMQKPCGASSILATAGTVWPRAASAKVRTSPTRTFILLAPRRSLESRSCPTPSPIVPLPSA